MMLTLFFFSGLFCFLNLPQYCSSTVLLQMAQIILFTASVALDSLYISSKKHRGTIQNSASDDAAGDDDAYLSHKLCDE